jgi:hypothetical protein
VVTIGYFKLEARLYVAVNLRTRSGVAYFEVNSDPADVGFGHRLRVPADVRTARPSSLHN